MHIGNGEEKFMVYGEYKAHKILYLYIPPLLLTVGTIGNVLSFCVLVQKTMRKTSTYNYLAVLSLTDMLVLYVGLLPEWIGELVGLDIANSFNWSCKLIKFLGYTVSTYSVWLLVAVTVERYIVTVHSLHAMTMCTRSRAIKVIVGILLLLVGVNLHLFWTSQLIDYIDEKTCYAAQGHEYLITKIWPWVDALLYSLLPFVIIIILNSLIVQRVIVARKHRGLLGARSTSTANGASSSSNRGSSGESSVRVTIMLLSISFTFLICTLPMNVTLIKGAFLGIGIPSDEEIAKFRLARTICELLMYTNHSINFYLYLLTGNKFRQQLLKMMCFCRKDGWSNRNYSVVTQANRNSTQRSVVHATEMEVIKNSNYS